MNGETKGAVRKPRNVLLWLATVTALTFSLAGTGLAQNRWARGPSSPPNPWARGPSSGPNPWARSPSYNPGAGYTSSYVAGPPGVIVTIPSMVSCGGLSVADGVIPDGLRNPRWPSKRSARRGLPDGPMAGNCFGYRTVKGRAKAN